MGAIPASIICSAQSSIVDMSRRILRQMKFMDVFVANNERDCLSKISLHQDAILLLDWDLGSLACLKILEKLQTSHPAGVRPIYLFTQSDDQNIQGVATEYGVMQINKGAFTKETLEVAIRKLLSTQTYSREVREALNQVMAARDAGDWHAETNILKSMLVRHPTDIFFVCELAESLIRNNRFEDALKLVEPYVDPTQKSPRLLNIHGRCLLKIGQFDRATKFLQQADLINPFNVERLVCLGEAYLQTDNAEKAKKSFTRALDIDPENRDAKVGVGKSMLLLGDINDALPFFKEISEPAEMASVFNVAAVIAIRSGRREDGMKLYRVACRTVGKDQSVVLSKIAFNMGLAFFRNLDIPKALFYFEISAKLNPKYDRGVLGYSALSKRVTPKERLEVGKDLFAALTYDKNANDDLAGEDMEFRKKAASYDMDF